MNEFKVFFKKNHWLIIPALLATVFVGLGVLLVHIENHFESIIVMPFVILGIFYVLLEESGMGVIGSIFLVWMLTLCSIFVIYYMTRLLYRIFAPIKVKQGS